MKFILLVIAAILAVALAAPLSEEQNQFLFSRFIQQYNKSYETNDFFSKYTVFKSNLNKIVQHNSANSASYTMAVNSFADLSEVEFMQMMGFKPLLSKSQREAPCSMSTQASVPEFKDVDWRKQGTAVLNPVKDQASCGSCWAFSAVQALEAANAITTGKLVDLSEQQLVDCSGPTGNQGCNGGLMNNAYDYLISAGGACLTSEYAYTAKDGACKKCSPVVQVDSYVTVSKGDQALADAVQSSPVAVALAATSAFQFYSKGIFSECSSTSLNHGVGLVGVTAGNDEVSGKAWIIRNSWGASWGMSGHIYLDATKSNCLGMSETAAKWNVVPKVKA